MKSTFQKLFANHVDHNMSREVVYIYLVSPSYYNTIKNTNETASTVVGMPGFNTNHPKINVKFVRRVTKEQFYRARKHLKDKSTRDIGFSTASVNKIFISESLT